MGVPHSDHGVLGGIEGGSLLAPLLGTMFCRVVGRGVFFVLLGGGGAST